MELLLAGTGGCTAYDVVLILKRGRHAVAGCSVKLSAERADTDPKVFTRIHFAFTVTGKNLPRAAVERAVQLSHEKYCSASAMLEKTAALTFSVDIVDTQETQARSEEHTSELQSLMRISYAVLCLIKKKEQTNNRMRYNI